MPDTPPPAFSTSILNDGADNSARGARISDGEARQWALSGLVGRSERFQRFLGEIRAAQGAAGFTVLLTGETGTGKELAAGAIHYGGAPVTVPLIRVDCAALPADQADLLLFGSGRPPAPGSSGGGAGAASAAAADRRSYCEQAEGGTLFLDEVADLPPALQARLLRVLEDGVYLASGSMTPRTLNARVIASTHADLPARVAAGLFRQDLYYRLARFHIAVPALRERMEDVPALARHFIKLYFARLKRGETDVRPDAMQRLLAHSYPGNIRELKNTVERALIEAAGADLAAHHIAFVPAVGPQSAAVDRGADATDAGGSGRQFLADLPLNLAAAEDILIARAVAVAEGNLSRAARLLGINRASLYRWQDRRTAAATAVAVATAARLTDETSDSTTEVKFTAVLPRVG